MTEQMTEEGLNFLETRAKSESYISMRDILDLIRLARAGLAVQPRPIAEAPDWNGDPAIVWYANGAVYWREIDGVHWNNLAANPRTAKLAPTQFVSVPSLLSALPKPGVE